MKQRKIKFKLPKIVQSQKGRKPGSRAEELLASQLDAEGIKYEREYRILKSRKFRHDFFIEPNLLIEVQGGVFMRGGHSTGTGITRDCEKQALAIVQGYRQLNVTTAQVFKGHAIQWIKAVTIGFKIEGDPLG